MFGKNFELNDTTMGIVKEIGRHMPGGFFIYKAEGKEELLYANSGQRYYRCDLGKVMMPEERIGIMIGFKDVDSEIRASQRLQEELESRLALQEKLIEEQSQREQQDKMITALASDYRVVYHIDLDKDEGVCYRADPDDKEQPRQGVPFPYLERFRWYAETAVDEAYREGFLEFIDPDHIRRAL